MEEKKFEELKKEIIKGYDDLELKNEKIKSMISKNEVTRLPEGFDFKLDIRDNLNLDDSVSLDLMFKAVETDRKDDIAKLFWTMGGNVILSFDSGNEIKYESEQLNGGQNSTEYKEKGASAVKIDPIDISEKILLINKSYLNIMKVAKNQPQVFFKHIEEYKKTLKHVKELRKSLDKEKTIRESMKKVIDIENVKEAFPVINEEKVKELRNQLKDSKEMEETISIVSVDISKNNFQKHLSFEEISIRCKHGAKITYAVSIGNDRFNPIKSSEVDDLLSQSIIVDGKQPTSIKDFKEMTKGKFDAVKTNGRSLYVAIEKASEIAKEITKENKKQNRRIKIESPRPS